jgi:hypothetical protein
MFSERSEPISELIKGNPEKPLREPALALLACCFNLYQIFELNRILAQLMNVVNLDPWLGVWYQQMMVGMATGLLWWNIAFSVILLIGAAIVYFLHRRVGGALILAIAIIALLVSFVSISVLFGNILSVMTAFLSAIFSMAAGISGVRGERASTPTPVQEII